MLHAWIRQGVLLQTLNLRRRIVHARPFAVLLWINIGQPRPSHCAGFRRAGHRSGRVSRTSGCRIGGASGAAVPVVPVPILPSVALPGVTTGPTDPASRCPGPVVTPGSATEGSIGTGTTGTGPTQARPITSSGGASRQKGKILYTQPLSISPSSMSTAGGTAVGGFHTSSERTTRHDHALASSSESDGGATGPAPTS
jgi:hypothetical protein